MKRFTLALILLLFPAVALSQTPPPPGCTAPLDFCESAWTVNVVGNYSSITNANTNNGFETEAGIRFANHISGEVRYYQTATPTARILVAGPQFDFGLGHLLKPTPAFDTTNVNLFVHFSPGFAWSTGTDAAGVTINGAKKFAFSAGGGADYAFSSAPNVQWRILEVSYVYAPMLPHHGQFLGNHVQVASGLRLVFGGTATPAAQARQAARKARRVEQLQREMKN
jgi:hypothetical protein